MAASAPAYPRAQRVLVSAAQRAFFHRHGFVVLADSPVLAQPEKSCPQLHAAFERCFRGEFSTKLYPDEWHWRAGISKDHAVREICNAWKADKDIANIVLSEAVGEIGGMLYGGHAAESVERPWQSSRVGQDDIIWKIPDTAKPGGGVGYHVDGEYISAQFRPLTGNSVTVWIALDDADAENGVVEYAAGSHLLSGEETKELLGASGEGGFHADADPERRRDAMLAQLKEKYAAKYAGRYKEPLLSENGREEADSLLPFGEVVRPVVPAGCCVVHHQNVLHGSGGNASRSRHRRALVVHLVDGGCRFADNPTYIYGRYKMRDSDELREEFFPTTWHRKKAGTGTAA